MNGGRSHAVTVSYS